jgi:hypothetical protein
VLGHFGLIDREVPAPARPPRRFELLRTHVVKARRLPLRSAADRLRDVREGRADRHRRRRGDRAPLDDCTIFMPTRQPIVGREGVYLTRPLR